MDDNAKDWIEQQRGEHESEKEWTIKRAFLVEHYDKFDAERLECLAHVFINMEMYGCEYPGPVMQEVRALGNQLADLQSYRADKMKREEKRISFVKATQPKTNEVEPVEVKKARLAPYKSVNTTGSEIRETNLYSSFVKAGDKPPENTNIDKTVDMDHDETEFKRPSFQCGSVVNEKVTENEKRASAPSLAGDNELIYKTIEGLIQLYEENITYYFPSDSRIPSNGTILEGSQFNLAYILQSAAQQKNIELMSEKTEEGWILTAKRPGPTPYYTLAQLNTNRAGINSKNIKALLAQKIISFIWDYSWIVVRKDLSTAQTALTNDDVQTISNQNNTDLSRGESFLKALGWKKGEGLGSTGQGIKTCVTVETTINRSGLGYGQDERSFQKNMTSFLEKYIAESRTDVLIFSKDFTSNERKVVHSVCRKLNLKSKSRGKGDSRCLMVCRNLRIEELVDQAVKQGQLETDVCLIFPPNCRKRTSTSNSP